jgi:hypothetical protein
MHRAAECHRIDGSQHQGRPGQGELSLARARVTGDPYPVNTRLSTSPARTSLRAVQPQATVPALRKSLARARPLGEAQGVFSTRRSKAQATCLAFSQLKPTRHASGC